MRSLSHNLKDEDLDEIISVMIATVNKLIADGIMTIDQDGFRLTSQGKAWVAIRKRLKINGGSR